MRVAFDLDGTLDKPALCDLAKLLINEGNEVHIITGIFDEAGEWQNELAKMQKLDRLGIEWERADEGSGGYRARVHFLHAMEHTFGRDYRLADLGLRKAEITQRFGISMIFDDSETYCKIMPAMNGDLTILRVM